jgi:spore coat protein H
LLEETSLEAAALDAPRDGSKLRTYELRLVQKDLTAMQQKAFSNETVPATFITEGLVHEDVRVRYRGAWARSWPKKPIKIFFGKETPFEEQRCLNLNSGWRDPALVRECLAYHVYQVCGAPAPEAGMVRLNVNGKFWGVYVQVEQPDQGFLKRLGFKGASVYKADSRSNQADERDLGNEAAFRRHYEKQTKKQESYDDLMVFCRELAQTSDVHDFFTRRVDIDKYINYLAAMVLTQNWDGFNKNHFLVHDRKGSGKWFPVPWDLDRTFGDHWNWGFHETRLPIFLGTASAPGVTGWNRMQDRFLSEPRFRARLLQRLDELLQTEFTPEKLFPVLDQLEEQVRADAALDRRRWPGPTPELREGIKGVKQYIQGRRAYLARELQLLQ